MANDYPLRRRISLFCFILLAIGPGISKAFESRDKNVPLNKALILVCPHFPDTLPDTPVTWRKNGVVLSVGTIPLLRDPRLLLDGDGHLTIKSARPDDAGLYDCQRGSPRQKLFVRVTVGGRHSKLKDQFYNNGGSDYEDPKFGFVNALSSSSENNYESDSSSNYVAASDDSDDFSTFVQPPLASSDEDFIGSIGLSLSADDDEDFDPSISSFPKNRVSSSKWSQLASQSHSKRHNQKFSTDQSFGQYGEQAGFDTQNPGIGGQNEYESNYPLLGIFAKKRRSSSQSHSKVHDQKFSADESFGLYAGQADFDTQNEERGQNEYESNYGLEGLEEENLFSQNAVGLFDKEVGIESSVLDNDDGNFFGSSSDYEDFRSENRESTFITGVGENFLGQAYSPRPGEFQYDAAMQLPRQIRKYYSSADHIIYLPDDFSEDSVNELMTQLKEVGITIIHFKENRIPTETITDILETHGSKDIKWGEDILSKMQTKTQNLLQNTSLSLDLSGGNEEDLVVADFKNIDQSMLELMFELMKASDKLTEMDMKMVEKQERQSMFNSDIQTRLDSLELELANFKKESQLEFPNFNQLVESIKQWRPTIESKTDDLERRMQGIDQIIGEQYKRTLEQILEEGNADKRLSEVSQQVGEIENTVSQLMRKCEGSIQQVEQDLKTRVESIRPEADFGTIVSSLEKNLQQVNEECHDQLSQFSSDISSKMHNMDDWKAGLASHLDERFIAVESSVSDVQNQCDARMQSVQQDMQQMNTDEENWRLNFNTETNLKINQFEGGLKTLQSRHYNDVASLRELLETKVIDEEWRIAFRNDINGELNDVDANTKALKEEFKVVMAHIRQELENAALTNAEQRRQIDSIVSSNMDGVQSNMQVILGQLEEDLQSIKEFINLKAKNDFDWKAMFAQKTKAKFSKLDHRVNDIKNICDNELVSLKEYLLEESSNDLTWKANFTHKAQALFTNVYKNIKNIEAQLLKKAGIDQTKLLADDFQINIGSALSSLGEGLTASDMSVLNNIDTPSNSNSLAANYNTQEQYTGDSSAGLMEVDKNLQKESQKESSEQLSFHSKTSPTIGSSNAAYATNNLDYDSSSLGIGDDYYNGGSNKGFGVSSRLKFGSGSSSSHHTSVGSSSTFKYGYGDNKASSVFSDFDYDGRDIVDYTTDTSLDYPGESKQEIASDGRFHYNIGNRLHSSVGSSYGAGTRPNHNAGSNLLSSLSSGLHYDADSTQEFGSSSSTSNDYSDSISSKFISAGIGEEGDYGDLDYDRLINLDLNVDRNLDYDDGGLGLSNSLAFNINGDYDELGVQSLFGGSSLDYVGSGNPASNEANLDYEAIGTHDFNAGSSLDYDDISSEDLSTSSNLGYNFLTSSDFNTGGNRDFDVDSSSVGSRLLVSSSSKNDTSSSSSSSNSLNLSSGSGFNYNAGTLGLTDDGSLDYEISSGQGSNAANMGYDTDTGQDLSADGSNIEGSSNLDYDAISGQDFSGGSTSEISSTGSKFYNAASNSAFGTSLDYEDYSNQGVTNQGVSGGSLDYDASNNLAIDSGTSLDYEDYSNQEVTNQGMSGGSLDYDASNNLDIDSGTSLDYEDYSNQEVTNQGVSGGSLDYDASNNLAIDSGTSVDYEDYSNQEVTNQGMSGGSLDYDASSSLAIDSGTSLDYKDYSNQEVTNQGMSGGSLDYDASNSLAIDSGTSLDYEDYSNQEVTNQGVSGGSLDYDASNNLAIDSGTSLEYEDYSNQGVTNQGVSGGSLDYDASSNVAIDSGTGLNYEDYSSLEISSKGSSAGSLDYESTSNSAFGTDTNLDYEDYSNNQDIGSQSSSAVTADYDTASNLAFGSDTNQGYEDYSSETSSSQSSNAGTVDDDTASNLAIDTGSTEDYEDYGSQSLSNQWSSTGSSEDDTTAKIVLGAGVSVDYEGYGNHDVTKGGSSSNNLDFSNSNLDNNIDYGDSAEDLNAGGDLDYSATDDDVSDGDIRDTLDSQSSEYGGITAFHHEETSQTTSEADQSNYFISDVDY